MSNCNGFLPVEERTATVYLVGGGDGSDMALLAALLGVRLDVRVVASLKDVPDAPGFVVQAVDAVRNALSSEVKLHAPTNKAAAAVSKLDRLDAICEATARRRL